jgi:DNA topoisomerase 2-associated protein PAT1
VCPGFLKHNKTRLTELVARPVHSIWEGSPSQFPVGGPDGFGRLPSEPHPTRSNFSPFDAPSGSYASSPSLNNISRNGSFAGYRTAQEVEEELRLATLRQREVALAEQRLLLQEQQALQYQQQQMYDPTQQLLRQHQLDLPQHTRTPPPRMHPHAQSPRFHQLQQQSQLDHHLRIDRQQVQEHALEITNQLRQEERARQLRHMELAAHTSGMHGSPQQQRMLLEQQITAQGIRANELQHLRQSPAFEPIQQLPLQHNIGNLDSIQMQQLLINRQANADFAQLSLVGNEQVGRRIMEAERMEERRRRKAAKIAHMVSLTIQIYVHTYKPDFFRLDTMIS